MPQQEMKPQPPFSVAPSEERGKWKVTTANDVTICSSYSKERMEQVARLLNADRPQGRYGDGCDALVTEINALLAHAHVTEIVTVEFYGFRIDSIGVRYEDGNGGGRTGSWERSNQTITDQAMVLAAEDFVLAYTFGEGLGKTTAARKKLAAIVSAVN